MCTYSQSSEDKQLIKAKSGRQNKWKCNHLIPTPVHSQLLYGVVKSSRLLGKITAYLISIGQLLCLAYLHGWRFFK